MSTVNAQGSEEPVLHVSVWKLPIYNDNELENDYYWLYLMG